MKQRINKFLDSIKDDEMENFSFTILLLWTISPIIEYLLKIYYLPYYTKYFRSITFFIGVWGIIVYTIYFIKLKKKKKINIKKFIPEILLLALLMISIISSIICKQPYLAFHGENYRKEGLFVYIMYIGFILSASIIKDNKYIKFLFKSIIIAGLIISINPLFKNNFTYVAFTNIFHNSNHYGYYLMINTMISLFMFINGNKLAKKIIYLLIYIFFLYLLIRNDTFGSYLAIIITLIFLFIYSMIKKYQRINVIFVIITFIATSFIVSNYDIKIGERVFFESTKGIVKNNIIVLGKDIKGLIEKDEYIGVTGGSYRAILWKEAWKYTLEHPIFGGGMENLKNYYIADRNHYYYQYNDRPHNSILQVSSFIGIPGAIIYIALILYIAISNLLIMKDNTLHIAVYCTGMCYFISSLFGNSMYYTSPYFMILLGFLIGFIRNNKKKKLTN